MKRTDEEVRAEALIAYQKELDREEQWRLELLKAQIERERIKADQLKEKLPDLQIDENYDYCYLGGYQFTLGPMSISCINSESVTSYGLIPIGYRYGGFVYDMTSFGRFLKFVEKEKSKESNELSFWDKIEAWFVGE
jgi:hypothetical protein